MSEFTTDDSGNIILNPVVGWRTGSLAGVAVLLQVRYADSPEDIGTEGKAIQFALNPDKCLELAEALTKQARRLLCGVTGN